jgi:phosphate/sulfate permease
VNVKNNFVGTVAMLASLVASAALFGGALILGWQCYYWLRNDVWVALPVSDGMQDLHLPVPASSWGGVQHILSWLLCWPSSVALPVVGTLIAMVMVLAALEAVKDQS